MRQRLLVICSALSLLPCVAAGGLWVRSYWRSDTYRALRRWCSADAAGVRDFFVHSARGRFYGACDRAFFDAGGRVPDEGASGWSSGLPMEPSGDRWRGRPGFSWKEEAEVETPPGIEFGDVFADHPVVRKTTRRLWSSASLTARWCCSRRCCPPTTWGAGAGPAPPGSACGYDLRATPERCPECGRETTAEAG